VGAAWLSSLAGLSLALGAFIAGLIVSQSEYSHQALGEIIPFRDVFSSLFLISIGMLLDLKSLHADAGGLPFLLAIVIGIILLKAVVVWGVTLILGYSFRVAVITGLTLAQIGEFSFVLALRGREDALLQGGLYQLFLASAVLSMMLTPLLKAAAPWVADKLAPLVAGSRLAAGRIAAEAATVGALDGHVIIIGFGLNGRNLAHALKRVSVPYLVIEMNPETVAAERRKGEPIFYGDATSRSVLEHAGVHRARVLVIAVSDPSSIRRSTDLARRMNAALHIIVRTRYLQEMKPLLALGANEVVPEEFETSLEIFARTLRKLLVPRDVVERFVREARQNGYGALVAGGRDGELTADARELVAGTEIEVFRVEPGSTLAGRSLGEANIRSLSGATVLALRHDGQFVTNPTVEAQLETGTVAIVFGTPEQVARAAELFRPAAGDAGKGEP
jgi:CPA2 family monovalent cation:H+ antiporter-2